MLTNFRISEKNFWHNYFFRIHVIKQSYIQKSGKENKPAPKATAKQPGLDDTVEFVSDSVTQAGGITGEK